MTADTRRQLSVLAALVAVYSLLAAATYLIFPLDQLVPTQGLPIPELTIPGWQLALANAGIGVFLYGLLGLAGYWLARRLGLPGVFRPDGGPRGWVLSPMLWGLGLGVAVGLVDLLFTALQDWPGFPQPPFPFSLVASVTAAIGEEILFRSFLLGLWAFLLRPVLRRWIDRRVALRIGNLLAALAFAAGHLASAMLLFGAASPVEIPPLILIEILLLNGAIGWVAGGQYVRQGLVAAVGLHFWVDAVLHVVRPLLIMIGR
jgi:membrane protease YdiL (CAAX protease family)